LHHPNGALSWNHHLHSKNYLSNQMVELVTFLKLALRRA